MTPCSSSSARLVRHLIGASLVAATLTFGLVTGERAASAAEVVLAVAPPPVRVEAIGRPPSPGHFWIPGYWGPRVGGGHVWVGGRWEHERRGYGWSRAHWGHQGRGWHFSPGRWHRR